MQRLYDSLSRRRAPSDPPPQYLNDDGSNYDGRTELACDDKKVSLLFFLHFISVHYGLFLISAVRTVTAASHTLG